MYGFAVPLLGGAIVTALKFDGDSHIKYTGVTEKFRDQ